jgi:hypothetical protein
MENEKPTPEIKSDPYAKIDNIKKEIVTTTVGIIFMFAAIIDFFTKWDMPLIEGVDRKYQLVSVFIIGFAHLFLKDTLIDWVKGLIQGFKKPTQ